MIVLIFLNWGLIIFGLIVSVFGFLFIGTPIIIGIIAIFEKVSYHKLTPLTSEQERKFVDKSKNLISDAISEDFSLCGYYTDGDKGILEGFISISISNDLRTILWIQKGGGAKYKFISELDNGQWMITSDISSITDLSKTDLEVMLPSTTLPMVYQYHLERLMSFGPRINLFNGSKFVDLYDEHRRMKLEKCISLGYMKYVNLEKNKASYTFKGAIELIKNQILSNFNAIEQQRLAEKREKTLSAKKKSL
ncbi:MAG: hypothetical protein WAQ98_17500 [Blastocatellia bacterium]